MTNQKTKFKFKYLLILSVIIHVFILKLHLEQKKEITLNKKKEEKIRIVLKERSNTNAKQIVTVESKGRKEKSDKAKFLSQNDLKVDRETVAKKIGSFKEAGLGTKQGVKDQKVIKEKVTEKQKISKTKTKFSLSDLSLGKDHKKYKKNPRKEMAALGLQTGSKNTTGLGQNNDFVEDVPLGDFTALNTIEYKYYGFYHRIKQKLEQYWGNTLREKATSLYKSGRRLPASTGNKITSLQIIIDDKGNIVKINVVGTSGINELDEAAIESFNKAGPFPNPPKGMMKDGVAQIEWGFVVKT